MIARRLGAAYTLCEVMLDQFILNVTKGNKAKRFLRHATTSIPAGAVDGGRARNSSPPAALKLVAAGFDVIDLNFGCPVKKVLGRCRGGFLLSDPATALEIVARVREALPPDVPLTVKMRRGMDDSQESREQLLRDLRRRVSARASRPSRSTAAPSGSVTKGPVRGSFSAR